MKDTSEKQDPRAGPPLQEGIPSAAQAVAALTATGGALPVSGNNINKNNKNKKSKETDGAREKAEKEAAAEAVKVTEDEERRSQATENSNNEGRGEEIATEVQEGLASSLETKTRMEDKFPFQTRGLARTPPRDGRERRERTYTMPITGKEIAVAKNPYLKEDETGKKRKPNSPPEAAGSMSQNSETSKTEAVHPKNWEKLRKCITEMNDFISLNNNVHKAIKNSVKTLNECVSEPNPKKQKFSFLRQVCTIEDENKTLKERVALLEKQVMELTEKSREEEIKTSREFGIQTENAVIERKKSMKREVKEEDIEDVTNHEVAAELLSLEWPEPYFQRAAIKEGNPLTTTEEDIAVILVGEKELQMDRGLGRQLKERFPKIYDSTHGGNTEITSILCQTTKLLPDGKEQTKVRCIHKLYVEEATNTNMWKALVKLKDQMARIKRDTVAIPKITGIPSLDTKKLAEMVFRATEIKVTVHAPRIEEAKTPQQVRSKAKADRRRTDAIIVKSAGKSYADLLRDLKEKMLANHVKDTIRNVRQTKNGDLLLVVEKKEGYTTTSLKKIITEAVPGATINARSDSGDLESIEVKDIDAVTTVEEIKASIEEKTGYHSGSMYIETRPSFGNCQVALIKLPKETAHKLREIGKLRIGLTICRVRPKVVVTKCFKCWNYGHIAKRCKGPDRTKDCRNCGQVGHIAKDCKEEGSCQTCKEKGHKLGSFKCIAYRRALMEATKVLTQKAGERKSESTNRNVINDHT